MELLFVTFLPNCRKGDISSSKYQHYVKESRCDCFSKVHMSRESLNSQPIVIGNNS